MLKRRHRRTSRAGNITSTRARIEEYLISKNAKVLGRVARHTSKDQTATIYIIESEKKRLKRKHWLSPMETENQHVITSNFHRKLFVKKPPHAPSIQVNEWVHGINLMTFLSYGGAYPLRKDIKLAVERIQDFTHNDWTVNNMILQGNKLALIDWDDPTHGPTGGRRCSSRVLGAHLHLVDLKDPNKIERYFWNRLIKT